MKHGAHPHAMRRRLLLALATLPGWSRAADFAPVLAGRRLAFPADHGAHPDFRTEWWYATGWLQGDAAEARYGFQVTFFRSRTGLAEGLPGRLAPRQLLFAHAAVTDLAARRHVHADRLARWSGQDLPDLRARASRRDADVHLDGWFLTRHEAGGHTHYETRITADALAMSLRLERSQPLLLQGDAGFSRKGPLESQASHYTSEPQLAAQGRVTVDGRTAALRGRAWIDHEWSDELLHPQAVGWDWIGMNLDDGAALTAFRLRRADGTALWAGGSWRPPGGAARSFGPDEVRFEPGRLWTSSTSKARYPLSWTVQTPAGRWQVEALLEAQELDSRQSTGTVYWEGLSALRDADGRQVGLGYLEMTGYAGRLAL